MPNSNNLKVKYPDIAKQWHPNKNGNLKPQNFFPKSGKKVWWKCEKGDDHEWETRILNRTAGKTGCPFCANQKVSKDNNLLNLHPEIARQWHPSKNGNSKPQDFTSKSGKKVWWKCEKGDDHEWETRISSRTSKNAKCPFCSGRRGSKSNNLITLFPKIAKEWHPTKNINIKIENFSVGSNKKVWWKCSKVDEHEWLAQINSRSYQGTGCPYCKSKTSLNEIRILTELRKIFGANNVKWREKKYKQELDVFIPKYNLGIEYDGYFWHKKKIKKDINKNKKLNKLNIDVIRVRELPLDIISDLDIQLKGRNLIKGELNLIIKKISKFVSDIDKVKLINYIRKEGFTNEIEYRKFISYLPYPPPEFSLSNIYPELVKEWHPKKNKPLTPDNFSPHSAKEVWWKCKKANDHEWKASIQSRLNSRTKKKVSCPFCAGRKASKKNNLLKKYPAIAKEIHPTKNGILKPELIAPGSSKRIWWKCEKGDDHEWETRIVNRTSSGSGCPYCSGRIVSDKRNLLTLYPKIAKQWHRKKNGKLKPENISPHSAKKVWWKCEKGDDHEWKTPIANRTSGGSGCPYCSGRIGSDKRNLLTLYPKIAKQWHRKKNGKLKPENMSPHSAKKVWWKCEKGDDHEWEATIGSRTKGSNCPFCSGLKASKENNFLLDYPKISDQWHPTKNGNLKPQNFLSKSNKKVWWKCEKGDDHEWETTIGSRTSGVGCPYCSNKKPSKDNNLLILYPRIAKQWNYSKNGNLKPKNFVPGSHKKVWWKCEKGDDHIWLREIRLMVSGSRCPFCSKKISYPQLNYDKN